MTLVSELKNIVGDGNWTQDANELVPYLSEWRDIWSGKTLLMVTPDSTDKVAAVVRACHNHQTGIVPQGGNTGLCGGAIPDVSGKQVLLSLRRMDRIRSTSPTDHSMIAEAGCTLKAIQDSAQAVDRFFPLSLAAEGSCQIGGNLSTNAGGINVLRFGTARSMALGLEVVLADGTIWNGLRSLRKDTAGYDLKQMFIGAEGTLGIITAACLRLFPALQNSHTAWLAVDSPGTAVELLSLLREQCSDQILAFELISERAVRYVSRHMPQVRAPDMKSQWYVLAEVTNIADQDVLESILDDCLQRGLITDATIAKNQAESKLLWRLRHSISEAQKSEGASLKHDVSVPVISVADFIREASDAVEQYLPGVRPVAFGHVGDGNIHFNLSQPRMAGPDKFLAERDVLATIVYDVVDKLDGSFSAEHGVGQAKKNQLVRYRGEVEVGLMRTLKIALDPSNIMNPGKVI